jgi:hypothetical protein
MPIQAKTRDGIWAEVMGKYKRHQLHSGSGGIVRSRRQAERIASELVRKHVGNPHPKKCRRGLRQAAEY